MLKILCIVAILSLSACEQSAVSDLGVGETEGAFIVRSYDPDEQRPATPEARQEFHDRSAAALSETRAIMRTSADWREADQRLEALVAQQSDPLRAHEFSRIAAARMLQPGVLPDQPETLDAVGRHTERLVATHSIDAPLIVAALDRLDGHWSKQQIQEAAGQAAAVSLESAAIAAECEKCTPGEIGRALGTEIEAEQGSFAARSFGSIAKLQEMAGRQ